jgi:hypothetical protein
MEDDQRRPSGFLKQVGVGQANDTDLIAGTEAQRVEIGESLR